jgi:hypothetical protein
VRLRALAFLLSLTVGDYLLWQWSIAGGHDILSLLAGCTLVPLAAVSVWRLVLTGAGLLSRAVGRSTATTSAARASHDAETTPQAPRRAAAESDSSSSKLAA